MRKQRKKTRKRLKWKRCSPKGMALLFYTSLMLPEIQNLRSLTSPATVEQFINLFQTPSFRLEKIVSNGVNSPKNFWYDQEETEWVMLAQGEAVLEFEQEGMLPMKAGDYLLIRAHQKHRVEFCSNDAVWLALHFAG